VTERRQARSETKFANAEVNLRQPIFRNEGLNPSDLRERPRSPHHWRTATRMVLGHSRRRVVSVRPFRYGHLVGEPRQITSSFGGGERSAQWHLMIARPSL
jgi:hypothetical protein